MFEKITEIINYIRTKQGKDVIENIKLTDNLRSDLGLDSLDLAELTVRLESEFGIDIFEDGLVETVNEIIEKLKKS